MIVLGLSGAVSHDPSAALFIDGELVAAAEEERFLRDKHAKGRFPYESARFCLDFAGIKPGQVDAVAFPYAATPLSNPARWHYAMRHWYAPDRALLALFVGNRRYHRNLKNLRALVAELGLNRARIEMVEHHLAHASSAYHLRGFQEKTAILGIDGKGESCSLDGARPVRPLYSARRLIGGRNPGKHGGQAQSRIPPADSTTKSAARILRRLHLLVCREILQ